jgi:hypothetical protein
MQAHMGKLDGNYYVYAGEKGTGKSSSLFHVLDGRTHACVVEIPEHCSDELFVDLLCNNMGIDRDAIDARLALQQAAERKAGIEVKPRSALDAFDTVMDWFEEVAVEMRDGEKSAEDDAPSVPGEVVTLVLDDINFLGKGEDSQILPALQNRIKRFSTKRICSVVAVVSEPTFVETMTHDVRARVRYVGQLGDKVATELLSKHLDFLGSGQVKGMVADAGVFAQHLVIVAAQVKAGSSVQEAVADIIEGERKRLDYNLALQPFLERPNQELLLEQAEVLKKAEFFKYLARKQTVSKAVAMDLLGSKDALYAAIRARILAYNPVTNKISFQSQLMHAVAKDTFNDKLMKRKLTTVAELLAVQAAKTEQLDLQSSFTQLQCEGEANSQLKQCKTLRKQLHKQAATVTSLEQRVFKAQQKLKQDILNA